MCMNLHDVYGVRSPQAIDTNMRFTRVAHNMIDLRLSLRVISVSRAGLTQAAKPTSLLWALCVARLLDRR